MPYGIYETSGPRQTVTLAHFSVKEYLVSGRIKETPTRYLAISDPVMHSIIAECCLFYILHYANSTSKTRDANDFPLIKYAAKYWCIHIRLAPLEKQELLTPHVLKFLLSESAVSSLRDIYVPRSFKNSEQTASALCYASNMGLFDIVQELLAGRLGRPSTEQ
jgi:ankyrin repeat domain-containing protein 50